MSHLDLIGLSKHYRGRELPALAPLDLSVPQGELLALLGESGSGKSTLLRLVAGFERPDTGQVCLAGRELAGPTTWVAPEQRAISMVFQDLALFPHLSVGDNIAYGLFRQARAARAPRVAEMLAMVGLPGAEKRYPHQLSGGERQRVALARALAPRPALLLLDEPLSALDEVLRLQIRHELARLIRATGTTAIWVTHDTRDALAMADRVAVLWQGRLQQVASPAEVFHEPATVYVARLFGNNNLFAGVAVPGGYETPLGFIAHAASPGDGRPAHLALRPEDMVVHGSAPEPRAVPMVVRELHYGGNYLEGLVAPEAGSPSTSAMAAQTGASAARPLAGALPAGGQALVTVHLPEDGAFQPGAIVYLVAKPGRLRPLAE